MKICTRCILPETFPGIRFDDDGVCNHCCRDEKNLIHSYGKKDEYRQKLDRLISETKGTQPNYDVIMAYSGGKDSTYTLKLLSERYGLRVLCLTFDNHFVSPTTWKNISAVTDTLDVVHYMVRPPWNAAKSLFALTAHEDIFAKPTLLRASSICTACIGLVKSEVLKTALEMSVPLVAFGWSPGQAPIQAAIMKTNAALSRQNQLAFKQALPENLRDLLDPFFIPESYFENYQERFPHNIHPLAFFEYEEDKIIQELQSLEWKPPSDTDTNSSNCLLNAFANYCHIQRHGFHPYVWEIANMVRQDIMSRDQGIKKIYTEQNPAMVSYAKERLGV